MAKKLLTRDQILSAEVPSEDVEVAEWGGVVRVRGLSATEALLFADDSIDESEQRRTGIKMAALCIVDENGARLFSDNDIEALAAKSMRALNRVTEVALRLSGMDDDAAERARGN